MAAFYSNTVINFLSQPDPEIFAELATAHLSNFNELNKQQEKSWKKFLKILRNTFFDLQAKGLLPDNSSILFEYKIPRRDKRIDCIIIIAAQLIVVEFKLGDKTGKTGKRQLEDYCLDLRDFHKESRSKKIFPILLSPDLTSQTEKIIADEKLVQNVIFANEETLLDAIEQIRELSHDSQPDIDYRQWDDSDYSPTPTIIEAVKTLYKRQSVAEITKHHAGIENLDKTTQAVVSAINHAKATNTKIICFITGVPGAGKTLAGLNIAHLDQFQYEDNSLATFLSGNVPLINVLREALKRDILKKYKRDEIIEKENESNRISSFIEKVHTFIDTQYKKKDPPRTKILIFDEAQRAWSKEHKTKKSEGVYNESEPHILFEIMNRHSDWCAIIALIGGGQEINTGESGLEEWGKTITKKFKKWDVYISPHLIGQNSYSSHKPLFKKTPLGVNVIEDEDLHLAVSIRSYNAEKLSDWVSAVLNNQPDKALQVYNKDLAGYPIYLTRDFEKAKSFLKAQRLGTRRVGLVASSGGRRLRAHGIDVDVTLHETHWFLNDTEDIRSSNFLELAGKDFKIQGLELDWTCVCWDADFHIEGSVWQYQTFTGTSWKRIKKETQQEFIKNKYRVLMTRAREGMVIWIPNADEEDITRKEAFLDPLHNYLQDCGCRSL